MAVVNSRGVTSYIPPFIVNSACKFDFTYYPYDEQTCTMKIGSWHHDGGKINLTTFRKTVDMTTFSNFNSKWIIKNMMIPVKRNVIKYECCPELYIDITTTFTIARQATYVTSVLVVPGVILAFLIPFVFMFPPDAGEKINLGVGLILGYILLLLIGDTISQGAMMASPPMIFRYYSVNIVLVGLSMIISMIVVQLWRDRGRATGPPHFLSTILVNSIGGLLCVRRENYKRRPRTVTIDTEGGMETDKIGQDGPDPNLEWQLVAMVLDRVLFIIFLVITIIVASVML